MDYADTLSLSLATSVLINFPRPRFAALPVSLGVELASIGGTVRDNFLARVFESELESDPDRVRVGVGVGV